VPAAVRFFVSHFDRIVNLVIVDNFFFIELNNKREVHGISRKSAPINVIVHYPKTEEGKRELAQRVAGVHADFVGRYIQQLNCPSEQKAELLNAVIASAKKNR
jgi:hypothetical protein